MDAAHAQGRCAPPEQMELFKERKAAQAPGPVDFWPKNFRDFTTIPRDYQRRIALSALRRGEDGKPVSTLVVLPTDSGKTLIAEMVAGNKLDEGRVIFIAHNGPLVRQQAKDFALHLDLPEEQIAVVTGGLTGPEERSMIYAGRPLVTVATSHVVARDIDSGRLSLEGVSMVISDESHYSIGEHPHNVVARAAIKAGIPRLALTASPGDSYEKIMTVVGNLGIDNIEIVHGGSKEIERYLPSTQHIRKDAELPLLFTQIRTRIIELSCNALSELDRMGMLDRQADLFSQGPAPGQRSVGVEEASKLMRYSGLESIKSRINRRRPKERTRGVPYYELGDEAKRAMHAVSLHAELMFYHDLLGLFETQSLWVGIRHIDNTIYGLRSGTVINNVRREAKSEDRPLNAREIRQLARIGSEMSKSFKRRIRDNERFMSMYRYIADNMGTLPEHPKVSLFKETVLGHPGMKFVVFTESRDQVKYLGRVARSIGVEASLLLGKSDGVTEADQNNAIAAFREDRSKLLISTRAGREGIDIPEANVINYDQVSSAIASIQRRGRARGGRPVKIIDFVTLGTSDEYHFNHANRAREVMQRALERLRREMEG